ncbi:MAG: hypothetical protein WBQ75_08530 [Acetobacteraceae bacterium]
MRLLACLAAGAILSGGAARADWLWFDDSQPGVLRVEANGFTLAPLVIDAGGVSYVVTNGTYDDRDLLLPGMTDASFAGTFSLYYATAATFTMTEFFLPSVGAAIPGAELVLNGVAEDGGEHVSGTFIGAGNPALPTSVPTGARVIVADLDGTFPFSTQNLSMLVSLSNDPVGAAEPAGLGVLGFALLGLAWARGRRGRLNPMLSPHRIAGRTGVV